MYFTIDKLYATHQNLLKLLQKRRIKSHESTDRTAAADNALKINLKHLPISFLLLLLIAQISLYVLGVFSWRHAMYRHADAFA